MQNCHDCDTDSCLTDNSCCDTSCSDSFFDTTCEPSCEHSCEPSCESSCDTSCETSCDTSCDTTCDCCEPDCDLCKDGSVPLDQPVDCDCKYTVGVILRNCNEQPALQCLCKDLRIREECMRKLCIDTPERDPEFPPLSCKSDEEKLHPSLYCQLKLLDEMVCSLVEECFDPIVLPYWNTEGYDGLQLTFIENFLSGEKLNEPSVNIRFSKVNFLIINPESSLLVEIEKYPNVTAVLCLPQ